jgi:hypothetical protein
VPGLEVENHFPNPKPHFLDSENHFLKPESRFPLLEARFSDSHFNYSPTNATFLLVLSQTERGIYLEFSFGFLPGGELRGASTATGPRILAYSLAVCTGKAESAIPLFVSLK